MTLIIDKMGGGKTMGAWGTSLYANDVACDIRGDYVEKLRSGKSNSDATRELMTQWADSLADSEEAPLFWFALADYCRKSKKRRSAVCHRTRKWSDGANPGNGRLLHGQKRCKRWETN